MPETDLSVAQDIVDSSEDVLETLEELSHDEQVLQILESLEGSSSDISESLSRIERILVDDQEYLVSINDGVSLLLEGDSSSGYSELSSVQASLDATSEAAQLNATVSLFFVAVLAAVAVCAILWACFRRFGWF